MIPAEIKNKIFLGDAGEITAGLPAAIVQTTVTSPPYYGKRDYGTGVWIGGDPLCHHKPSHTLMQRGIKSSTLQGGKNHTGHRLEGYLSLCKHCGAERVDKQLGLERSPEEYITNQLKVFQGIHRITRKDGTLWVVIGDSAATGGRGHNYSSIGSQNTYGENLGWRKRTRGLQHKDIVGIPWRFAFAMQGFAVIPMYSIYEWVQILDEAMAKQDWEMVKIVRDQLNVYNLLQGLKDQGWILRQDIIWAKPNPMPESVKDRCTRSHEYIFLFSKHKKYYYDADALSEPVKESTIRRALKNKDEFKILPGRAPRPGIDNRAGNQGGDGGIPYIKNMVIPGQQPHSLIKDRTATGERPYEVAGAMANKKDVWWIPTQPFKMAHFAVFPLIIPKMCIMAGSKPGDLVYDPYMGSGRTAVASRLLDRFYAGSELNPANIGIADVELNKHCGLFAHTYSSEE